MVFNLFPTEWLWEAGEYGSFAVFVAFGIYETVQQLRG